MAGSPSVSVSCAFLACCLLHFCYFFCKTPTSCVDDGRQPLLIVHGLFDLELSMRYETLTLGGNVIRFPVELRAKPSIDLLIDVAPDLREVELIAEAFGFDAPDPEGRAKADRAMADRIAAMDLPVDRQERLGGIERDPEAARRSRGRRVRSSATGVAAIGRGQREVRQGADGGRLLVGAAKGGCGLLGGRGGATSDRRA